MGRPSRHKIAAAQVCLLPYLDLLGPAAESCWACGSTDETPQRAHIQGVAVGGDNDPTNFVLLCQRCHREHPDGAGLRAQLLWLVSHETCLERQQRRCAQLRRALIRIFAGDTDTAERRLAEFIRSPRRSEPIAHCGFTTDIPNLEWSFVDDLLRFL